MDLTPLTRSPGFSIEVPDFADEELSLWQRVLQWLGLRQPPTPIIETIVIEGDLADQQSLVAELAATKGIAQSFSITLDWLSSDEDWTIDWTGFVQDVYKVGAKDRIRIIPVAAH